MTVKVYVEGGGDGRELRARCRRGFSSFFARADLAGRMPRVIACGSRQSAYVKFRAALASGNVREFFVLLVDSEGSVAEDSGPWLHVMNRDTWAAPDGATDDNAHLMVQCMETWFLADRERLEAFFGSGFDRNALPGHRNIKEIAKADVFEGLKNATRRCQPRGEYGKGRHSFEILSEIDPSKVLAASPHAKRLIDTLQAKAQ